MPNQAVRCAARWFVTGLALVIGVGLVGSIHWIYLDLHPAAAAAAAAVTTAGNKTLSRGFL